jgi:hypothetical protein
MTALDPKLSGRSFAATRGTGADETRQRRRDLAAIEAWADGPTRGDSGRQHVKRQLYLSSWYQRIHLTYHFFLNA